MKPFFKAISIIALSLCLLSGTNQSDYNSRHKYYDRTNGLVPDKETAIKIAEVILVNVYGEEQIKKQKPFVVTLLKNKIWIVEGSFKNKATSLRDKGGVAHIEIQKSDCKILLVTHGK